MYKFQGIFLFSSLSFTMIPDVYLLGSIVFSLLDISQDSRRHCGECNSGNHTLLKRLAQEDLSEAHCLMLSLYFSGASFS